MTRKEYLKDTLIACLFFLSLGGYFLHIMTHPLVENEYFVPILSGIISVFFLPILFWFKRTTLIAYLINGFLIIIATITMAHYSIVFFKGPYDLYGLLFHTTFADIMIAWAKFFVGKAIFDLQFVHSEMDPLPKGRWFRWPNTGFWLVHLVGLSVVYALGNILWR